MKKTKNRLLWSDTSPLTKLEGCHWQLWGATKTFLFSRNFLFLFLKCSENPTMSHQTDPGTLHTLSSVLLSSGFGLYIPPTVSSVSVLNGQEGIPLIFSYCFYWLRQFKSTESWVENWASGVTHCTGGSQCYCKNLYCSVVQHFFDIDLHMTNIWINACNITFKCLFLSIIFLVILWCCSLNWTDWCHTHIRIHIFILSSHKKHP